MHPRLPIRPADSLVLTNGLLFFKSGGIISAVRQSFVCSGITQRSSGNLMRYAGAEVRKKQVSPAVLICDKLTLMLSWLG